MKIFVFVVCLIVFMTISAKAQMPSEADFRAFDRAGKPVKLEQIAEASAQADAVFLGEQHDDATAHLLETEILRRVFEYAKKRKIILSMEMFERDVQIVMDEYLRGLITEKKFLDDSRPWNNYKTDYRPLVEFAKQNNLPVVAANAPRRYVNMVSRLGRDSLKQLSPDAKKWLAPLPYAQASQAYADKFKRLMGAMPEAANGLNKILDSQSLWDATMADSVAKSLLLREENALVLHINGAFHTENRLGIVEHLLKYKPKTRVIVITMKSVDNFPNFDATKDADAGDFVILTNPKLPRSFGQK
jgi:uncharacterized iron-regulated protein